MERSYSSEDRRYEEEEQSARRRHPYVPDWERSRWDMAKGYAARDVGAAEGRSHVYREQVEEPWKAPGPHEGRGPRGYRRSDQSIFQEVSERLMEHGQIDASEMEVEVYDGEVTLRGRADSRYAKRTAEDVAQSVSGVRDVRNELEVRDQAERMVGQQEEQRREEQRRREEQEREQRRREDLEQERRRWQEEKRSREQEQQRREEEQRSREQEQRRREEQELVQRRREDLEQERRRWQEERGDRPAAADAERQAYAGRPAYPERPAYAERSAYTDVGRRREEGDRWRHERREICSANLAVFGIYRDRFTVEQAVEALECRFPKHRDLGPLS